MKFHVFMLPSIGEPHELRRGMAGQDPEQYQRMLRQVSEIVHGALHFEEFFIWLNQGLSPHEEVLANLELFAQKVMPRLK